MTNIEDQISGISLLTRIFFIMSSLLELPEEILIIIIKQLDTKSAHNLYQTCQTMKNILVMKGVIKVCNLTLNTLASVKSLKLEFLKNISEHLCELNMSGVCDLTKTLLLPAVKRMKCLKTLNVAYTDIIVVDLLDIHKSCPTIKNIAMNCVCIDSCSGMISSSLHEIQEVLTKFVNVHFVLNSMMTSLPFSILEKSYLDTFIYTVYAWKGIVLINEESVTDLQFNHFCVFLLKFEKDVYYGAWDQLQTLINMKNVEFIIIDCFENTYTICKSSVFTNFFDESMVTSFVTLDLLKEIHGDVAIFMWNKETTIFDDLFFCNLKKRLKGIFTCEFTTTVEPPLPLSVKKHWNEWFHVNSVSNERSQSTESFFKKRRVSASQILDFDIVFSEYKSVKLSVYFVLPGIVTLSPGSVYLRKLTFLSLTGSMIRYSNEFFNVLFRCCEKLETLNVEASPLTTCCAPIMRSIPLSQSLKNLRLSAKRIDFKMLFSSFSQCKTLENIYIIDHSTEFNDLADPTLLYGRCSNLYNLFICAAIKESLRKKLLSRINKFVKSDDSNHYMYFSLSNSNYEKLEVLSSHPNVRVFNLSLIKPV